MDRILAKQVEGAVDRDSDQQISGTKTFSSPVVMDKQGETHHMIGYGGFMYWATDPTRLDQDGNYRMGVVGGSLITEQYFEGRWNNISG